MHGSSFQNCLESAKQCDTMIFHISTNKNLRSLKQWTFFLFLKKPNLVCGLVETHVQMNYIKTYLRSEFCQMMLYIEYLAIDVVWIGTQPCMHPTKWPKGVDVTVWRRRRSPSLEFKPRWRSVIYTGSRTISPWTISPRQYPPRQHPPGQYPPDNIPPDNIPPDNIPRTISPLESTPWTISPLESTPNPNPNPNPNPKPEP